MGSGIRVGINLAHLGYEISPELMKRYASRAEELGFSTLWTTERLLRPVGSVDLPLGLGSELPAPYGCLYTPIETMAFLAGHTERIRLGTSVLNALFHNPADLGRRLATIDHLSGGRLVVGLGQGYVPEEFTAAGVPIRRRGRGFDDFIHALRAVWGPDPVAYDGEFYKIPPAEISPKPLTPGGPTVLMGAASTAAARRAGRLGLGINPIGYAWTTLEEQIREFRDSAGEAGHDPSTLPIVVRGLVFSAGGPFATAESPLAGSIDSIKADVDRLLELDVHEISFDLTIGGFTIDEQFEMFDQLAGL